MITVYYTQINIQIKKAHLNDVLNLKARFLVRL